MPNYGMFACIDCGKVRRVCVVRGKSQNLRCKSCHIQHNFAGEHNPHWKGGRIPDGHGYIKLKLRKDDPFLPMCRKRQNNYIPEHRYVMAKHLGRLLESWEIVHHKNHIKTDNRIENLELLPSHDLHLSDSVQIILIKRHEQMIKQLEGRILLLEAENILLKSEMVKWH